MKKNTKRLNKYLSLSLGVGMTLGGLIQPISVIAEPIEDVLTEPISDVSDVIAEPNGVVQNEQNKVIPKESIEDVQNEPISDEDVLTNETKSEIGKKDEEKSEEKLNTKDAADKIFEEKKQSYKKSKFQMTQNLCTYPHWDSSTIKERQLKMAKTAAAIWKAEY